MRKAQVCWLLVALCGALLAAGPVFAQSFEGTSASTDGSAPSVSIEPRLESESKTEPTPVLERPTRIDRSRPDSNPVDRQSKKELPTTLEPRDPSLDKPSDPASGARGAVGVVNVPIGALPGGKSITIFFDVVVDAPFPNGIPDVANQGVVSGATFPDVVTDDPDTGAPADPTLTAILAAPVYAGGSKTVSDVPLGNGDNQAQPGEILTYTIALVNTGNGGDSNVNVNDVLPAEALLDLGSVNVVLGGGASGAVDASAGNTLDITVASVPGAGGSVTVTFNATVAAAIPAGLELLSNTAQISSPKTLLFDTSQANIPIDALPAFTLVKDDGGVNVDPGSTVVYTLTYTNTGDQDASNVMLEDTVPVGSLFDAGASTAGWSCFDGDPVGTVCTIAVGTVAAGASPAVDFAVEVVPPQEAPPLITNSASVQDDGAGSGGVPVEASDSDSTPVNDLLPPTVVNVDTIKGNGDGTLEECESVGNLVSAFKVEFSEGMTAATVTDIANWQVVGSGPDLDLSTLACGPPLDDDVAVPVNTVSYDPLTTTARVELGTTPHLEDGPYRLMACSGATGIEDAAGNELDGDGDFNGGDDFVRYFRIDQIDAFANGHFDCGLEDWTPVTGGGSTIEHDAATDMDNAGISGSARFTNAAGNRELALGQCVEVGGGAVHDFSGFVLLETPLTSIQVIRTCGFFTVADCTGAALPTQAFFSTVSTAGVWVPFAGVVPVPLVAQSALCQATLRQGINAPYAALLDDLSLDLLQSPIIFEDGFESGDTSAWSQTVP